MRNWRRRSSGHHPVQFEAVEGRVCFSATLETSTVEQPVGSDSTVVEADLTAGTDQTTVVERTKTTTTTTSTTSTLLTKGGIKGESTQTSHGQQNSVESFSWSATNTTTTSTRP